MPPRKASVQQPQRRSKRLESKVSSRASSLAADDHDDEAVLNGITERATDLERRIQDLEEQNTQLSQERDAAVKRSKEKPSLRDEFFAQRLKASLEQRERERVQEEDNRTRDRDRQIATIANITRKEATTPASKQDIAVLLSTAPAKLSSLSTMELASSSLPSAQTGEESEEDKTSETTPKPATGSFLSRFFNTISSPFTTARHTSTLTPQPPRERLAQPLGELSANRKRPASEPAPEQPLATTFTPRSVKTPRARLIPSNKYPLEPSSLSTINEHSEVKDSITMSEATPTRAPRSVTRMRREAREKERLSKPPLRSWLPSPREPNADSRLEKLRQYRELESRVEELKEDDEIKEMIPRRVKRVKIDELAAIPHNRPGDPSGTFRVYDVDSDEEMEVDEEKVQLRTNIFEVSDAQNEKHEPATQIGRLIPETQDSVPGQTPAAVVVAVTAPAPAPAPAQKTKAQKTEAQKTEAQKTEAQKTAQRVAEAPALTDFKKTAQTEAEAPALKITAQVEARAPAPAPTRVREVFAFPSVGKNGRVAQPNPVAGKKFAYGFALYQQTGQMIAW